jgi:hypothetical protein
VALFGNIIFQQKISHHNIITLMFISNLARSALLTRQLTCGFSVAGESTFLEMVSQYFDKAGAATGIPKDRLNFLKSPDYSLKFNIPYRTGTPQTTQTPDLSKWWRHTGCSTRPTVCPPREEPATPAASTCRRWRPSPAS